MKKLLFLLIAVVGAAAFERKSMFVDMMSMQMIEADKVNSLPDLPSLARLLHLRDLVIGLTTTGLSNTLSGEGPFTLFAPKDLAFRFLPLWVKMALWKNATLTEFLSYHALSGRALSTDIKDETSVKTLQGSPVRFNIYPKNNVITVQCAPIDLKNVDKLASNGVLHEIYKVLIPPVGDIVKSVSLCPVFKTLVTAVKAADLAGTLSGDGPFTLFAPTDRAFAKIPKAVLQSLLKNKTALTEVLTYHVVNLTYCSVGLASYDSLTTLNGLNISIAAARGRIMVNDAYVLFGGEDGSVTNGVVHSIDTVLIPPSVQEFLTNILPDQKLDTVL